MGDLQVHCFSPAAFPVPSFIGLAPEPSSLSQYLRLLGSVLPEMAKNKRTEGNREILE